METIVEVYRNVLETGITCMDATWYELVAPFFRLLIEFLFGFYFDMLWKFVQQMQCIDVWRP